MLPVPGSPDLMAICAAFLTQAGSRHLSFDLTDGQRKIMAHPVAKLVVLLGMFYFSTRNIGWSVTLLLIYYLAINMLINEKHPMNVLSPSWLVANGYVEKHSTDPEFTELYRKNVDALSR